MIRLIDFEPDHAEELFTLNTSLATADHKFLKRRWIENMKREDRSFTLIDNGHLIVAGGIFEIWPGMGEAWLIPSDKIDNYKLKMIKTLRRHMDKIIAEDNLVRLQASVREDFPVAHRFIEFMGFKREGLMTNYGPDGANHILYARTTE